MAATLLLWGTVGFLVLATASYLGTMAALRQFFGRKYIYPEDDPRFDESSE